MCIRDSLWEYGILMKKQPGIYDDISEFVIKKITVRQMTEKAVLIQAGNQMQEEYLKNWDENKVYDEVVKEEIEKRFSFVYPYKYLEEMCIRDRFCTESSSNRKNFRNYSRYNCGRHFRNCRNSGCRYRRNSIRQFIRRKLFSRHRRFLQ